MTDSQHARASRAPLQPFMEWTCRLLRRAASGAGLDSSRIGSGAYRSPRLET